MSAPTLAPLAHQVAGHAGVQTSSGGAVVVKTCLPVEHAFYTQLAPQLGGDDFVGSVTPAFFGVLKLQGKVGEGGEVVGLEKGEETEEEAPKEALVLENLTHPFLRPNVLDIKLGTQLYDADASPEKVERMKQASLNTTSSQSGVRLTGFSVWNPATSQFELTPKTYGKSITVSQLPEGISKFFPLPPTANSNPTHAASLLQVLRLILGEVERLISRVKHLHWSVRGGSVLIVYEGDLDALGAALERGDDGDEEIDSDEEEGMAEGVVQEEGGKKRLISHKVRLIDFAHARKEEAEDEGYNLGLETTRKLLEGRIRELEKSVKA